MHTNLGRAPLSAAARDALIAASGYVDVEYDLADGSRAARGRATLAALRASLPDAGDVMVVNNGAAALLLAVTVLASGREVVWSRGELVEIGDGFRLPDLVACTGATLREVGTTNRTTRADYVSAIGDTTGCLLKVHPSNFRMTGFTSSVAIGELAALGPPLVVDVGSGLLASDRLLPDEPDIATALRSGADVVTASGDKLLGGPQAGLIAGRADLIARCRRSACSRPACRQAHACGARSHAERPAHTDRRGTRSQRRRTARACRCGRGATRRCGARRAERRGGRRWQRSGRRPARLGREPPRTLRGPVACRRACRGRASEGGRCLLDLRCVPSSDDDTLVRAVLACR